MLQKEAGFDHQHKPNNLHVQSCYGLRLPRQQFLGDRPGHVYSGLFDQVYKAAGQMRWYGNRGRLPTPISKPGKIIQRPYSTKSYPAPDKNGNVVTPATCGFAEFKLQNQATANLYYYTPYAPNDAALKSRYSFGLTRAAPTATATFGATTGIGSAAQNGQVSC
jgi:hypothetical protein